METKTRGGFVKVKLAPNLPESFVVQRAKILPGTPYEGKMLPPQVCLTGKSSGGESADCYLPGAYWAALKALKNGGVVPQEFQTPEAEAITQRIDVPLLADDLLVTLLLRKLPTDEYNTLVVTRVPAGHEAPAAPRAAGYAVPSETVGRPKPIPAGVGGHDPYEGHYAPRAGTTQPPKPTVEDEGYLDAVLADNDPWTGNNPLPLAPPVPKGERSAIEDGVAIANLMLAVREHLEGAGQGSPAMFEHARAIAITVYIERCKRGKSL